MIEQDINTLATTHIDERELLLSKYESELATLHQKQYSEFRQVSFGHPAFEWKYQEDGGGGGLAKMPLAILIVFLEQPVFVTGRNFMFVSSVHMSQ